jgi:hypothetical protein
MVILFAHGCSPLALRIPPCAAGGLAKGLKYHVGCHVSRALQAPAVDVLHKPVSHDLFAVFGCKMLMFLDC